LCKIDFLQVGRLGFLMSGHLASPLSKPLSAATTGQPSERRLSERGESESNIPKSPCEKSILHRARFPLDEKFSEEQETRNQRAAIGNQRAAKKGGFQ
jgi:hypothetical protein